MGPTISLVCLKKSHLLAPDFPQKVYLDVFFSHEDPFPLQRRVGPTCFESGGDMMENKGTR